MVMQRDGASHEADFALFVLDFEFDEAIFMHQVEKCFELANIHHITGRKRRLSVLRPLLASCFNEAPHRP